MGHSWCGICLGTASAPPRQSGTDVGTDPHRGDIQSLPAILPHSIGMAGDGLICSAGFLREYSCPETKEVNIFFFNNKGAPSGALLFE